MRLRIFIIQQHNCIAMKKNLLSVLFLLTTICAYTQQEKKDFDPVSWKPPYTLPLEEWGIERFVIPPDFAPKIAYKGIEDLRFTKGWGDSTSSEYWSYAFLWFIDGKPKVNETLINQHLQWYYDGLIKRNIEPRKIPADKVKPTIVSVAKNTIASEGDIATYSGTISMLDYMSQKPMILNIRIHYRTCSNQDKKFLFHQLSPQPLTQEVWKKMEALWDSFKCED